MKIIPAIDLKGGKCVRLLQGRFDRETQYGDDPLGIAATFARLAVTDLHVVDLDGARTGRQANAAVIRDICAAMPFDIQIGGGLRQPADVAGWFDRGVARCVIGSAAIENPDVVDDWLQTFGVQRLVLALDVAIENDLPMLATRGWTETTSTTLWQCLDHYVARGVIHVLCTDVRRDGALTGPNAGLYRELVRRFPTLSVQASGGVRGIADLEVLESTGVAAAITGRALLDGKLTADEVASFRQSA